MNSQKAVIFDLDGVLVSSDEYHFESWKKIAEKLNIPFDHDKNHQLRGISRRESLLVLVKGFLNPSEQEIEKLCAEKNELFLQIIRKAGKKLLLPGVMDFLKKMKKMGFRLAVASSSKNTHEIMRLTGLDKNIFEAVVDGNEAMKSKPDPQVFLLAAEKMNIPPRDCIVVEDAPSGVEGARRAGMGVFGVGPAKLGNCDIRKDSLCDATPSDIAKYFALN